MIEVAVAIERVLAQGTALPPEELPTQQALGCILAEDVTSDIDSPPHDKSVVDGFAVRATDCGAPVTLQIVEEVLAGAVPTKTLSAGQATRIMTGAPIPHGADAVVMVEKTELVQPQNEVRILQTGVRPGQNIVRRGQSMRKGDVVLKSGRILRPVHLGLLAEVGRTAIRCTPRPRVAIIATGDEIVPASCVPAAGQIRNSNEPMLEALVADCGGQPNAYGGIRDDLQELKQGFGRALDSADILVLSGGVSEGVADLVPKVLTDLGVRQIFHKVNLKPGKPIWFGVKEHEGGKQTLVFGLPGNPVSTLVCFQLFVRPAIEKLSGREPRGMERVTAALTKEFSSRGDRPTYWPGKLVSNGESAAEPLSWQGSGDLRTLADADCLILFPTGETQFAAGSTVTAYRL